MQWWNDFVTWIQTTDGHRTVFLAALVLLAVILGALIAGSIVRSAIKRLIRQQQEERKNAVVATLVDAAAEAAAWSSLSSPERVLNDRAVGQAQTHLRLLPVKGSALAANWAEHELAALKRSSSTGGYQIDASVTEFRDRLVQWRDRPGRARKAFLADLERWKFSDSSEPATQAEATGRDYSRPEQSSSTAAGDRSAAPAGATAAGTIRTGGDGPVTVGSVPAHPSTPAAEPAEQSSAAPRSVPAIVLPAASSDQETQQLLADVDRLEVRHEPPAVEEFEPVEPAHEEPVAADGEHRPAASVSDGTDGADGHDADGRAVDGHGEPRGTL